MSARPVVIAGYGMAGARLADEIRRRDPAGERVRLTVVGAEPHPAYNRVLLSSVVAGGLSAEMVRLHDEGWAARTSVDLRLDTAVTAIDRRNRCVETKSGPVPYDALVLATGAAPWLPPVEGLEPGPDVVAFRTLDDCARILDAARPGAPVAVLGGGLLGLEAARGLAGRGANVTVVHPRRHVMERQLDAGAGRVLARRLAELGVTFRFEATAARYLPGDGLKLDDGTLVPADLVVVAAGVRPETALAEAAGLAVDRGVLVDDLLRTNDGRIHALGDCARHANAPAGLVQPAWEQASVLADLLTGADTAARYRGTTAVTRLKARDVDLTAVGETHVTSEDAGADVLTFDDPSGGRYGKLVIRGNRVTGAILLGLPDAAATVTQFHDRGIPLPDDRLAVLLGRALPAGTPAAASPADLPASALICRCNAVTKGRLVDAWRGGATDVAALARVTRATTGCGGCRDTVGAVADWLAAQ
ncbi:FAD-dependent oxidoreductase [Amycolatopsis saalfeldensis]|uniref:Assimilatory nitrate reductase electron transfer subunit n=1 Tax=Amycolatopsis saalfeldensis TaxID=394193 RepID=A0A1H8YKM5_9PSEU|nr:FAD-dependent oxidoreductase [Amycolatopsis saalfeldensis]SEP52591.1 assimilatory nitrate reductase electron transfer subunit [Amycolatopsis saalfeldensis]